jgi:hypothetical protein
MVLSNQQLVNPALKKDIVMSFKYLCILVMFGFRYRQIWHSPSC